MEVIGVNSQTPVAFSKHYMSHYTLGLLKTIKDFSNDVNERKLNPSEKLNRDLDKWESIVNVAKEEMIYLIQFIMLIRFSFLKNILVM